MEATTRQTVITEKTIKVTGMDIFYALRAYYSKFNEVTKDVYLVCDKIKLLFEVPSGGDWSGTKIDLINDIKSMYCLEFKIQQKREKTE